VWASKSIWGTKESGEVKGEHQENIQPQVEGQEARTVMQKQGEPEAINWKDEQ
jgi:hypothetical protein